MAAHLFVVPPPEQRQEADGPHPVEVARKALLEAALIEREPFWREHFVRFAECLPPTSRPGARH
jgi:hypothetical protein